MLTKNFKIVLLILVIAASFIGMPMVFNHISPWVMFFLTGAAIILVYKLVSSINNHAQ
jgi:hypothetical protein